MLLYAATDRRAAALRQYQECVRQFNQELGVTPLPETTALYHAIQENRLQVEARQTLQAERTPEQAAARSVDYPLVGRRNKSERLYREIQTQSDTGHTADSAGRSGDWKNTAGTRISGARGAGRRGDFVGAGVCGTTRARLCAVCASIRATLQEPQNAAHVEHTRAACTSPTARLVPNLRLSQQRRRRQRTRPPPFRSMRSAASALFDAVIQVILRLLHSDDRTTGSTGRVVCGRCTVARRNLAQLACFSPSPFKERAAVHSADVARRRNRGTSIPCAACMLCLPRRPAADFIAMMARGNRCAGIGGRCHRTRRVDYPAPLRDLSRK